MSRPAPCAKWCAGTIQRGCWKVKYWYVTAGRLIWQGISFWNLNRHRFHSTQPMSWFIWGLMTHVLQWLLIVMLHRRKSYLFIFNNTPEIRCWPVTGWGGTHLLLYYQDVHQAKDGWLLLLSSDADYTNTNDVPYILQLMWFVFVASCNLI